MSDEQTREFVYPLKLLLGRLAQVRENIRMNKDELYVLGVKCHLKSDVLGLVSRPRLIAIHIKIHARTQARTNTCIRACVHTSTHNRKCTLCSFTMTFLSYTATLLHHCTWGSISAELISDSNYHHHLNIPALLTENKWKDCQAICTDWFQFINQTGFYFWTCLSTLIFSCKRYGIAVFFSFVNGVLMHVSVSPFHWTSLKGP